MNAAAKRTLAVVVTLAASVGIISAIALAPTPPAQAAGKAMEPFASEKSLSDFLAAQRKARPRLFEDSKLDTAPALEASASVAKPGEPMGMISPAADKITNTQEAEVDEGGIVKVRGELLIILRRGRLFTVSTAGGGLRPVDRIDAFPPGASGEAWYDEMLVAGDMIAVVGYSHESGGTEINRFRLLPDGQLSFLDSHALRSADYYASRNYASRLIGNRMIFYSELPLGWGEDPMESLPALRRWTPGTKSEFRRIAAARRIYAPRQVRSNQAAPTSIHTVTTCDLAAEAFDCQATAVLGPGSRTFYVSKAAVYLWVTTQPWERAKPGPTLLYRLPLDGAAPQAIQVNGAPIDQFSFREAPDGKRLHVLVARDGAGDGMWGAEQAKPRALALLTLPLDLLDDGRAVTSFQHYRTLPSPGAGWALHDRFVGDHLLYGLGADWDARDVGEGLLLAAPLDGGPVASIPLPHPVDRIEAMGPDAVVVGSGGGAVWFSTIRLRGGPAAGDRFRLADAAEGESRSHGFFYRPDSADGTEGVLGLPVARAARPAYHQLFENSAALLFLRRARDGFQPLGQLAAAETGFADDGCIASCVDWYGNARPIFLRGRVFALLGYELVEGHVRGPAIHEIGRVSFAPPPAPSRR